LAAFAPQRDAAATVVANSMSLPVNLPARVRMQLLDGD
jgi:hypothetical protein